MRSELTKTRFTIAALAIALFVAGRSVAEDGVTSKEIVLGQSCAISGPAQALGTGMRAGLQACFAKINEEKGIHDRTIRLITKDDGYEPDRAIKNVRELIEKERVFLLIGEVGTPTSKAVVPIAEEAKVPFFGPFTGAEFLRNPCRKYVINVRGSYYQEMEKLVEHLVDKKGLKRIACFHQNDDYGQAGLKGLQQALKKRSIELAATGNYERNTVAVKGALLEIRKAAPDAVVMVGAYKPCAEFIKLAKKVGMKDTVFCNISFVGTESLRKELGPDGQGCIISQVVPLPWNESIPLVAEYAAAMKKYQPDAELDFTSLEGYMAGKLFCMTMQKLEGEPTREAFIETLDKAGQFDLGGERLKFSPQAHQGMDEVFLTVIKDGTVGAL